MAIDTAIKKTLDEFGLQLVEDLIDSLERNKHVGFGNNGSQSSIAGSIKFKIFGKDTEVLFSLLMNDYWKYLENGRRKGTQPPSQVFDEWQTSKGINALAIYRSKLKRPSASKVKFKQAQKGLSFAIAKSIKEKGTIKRFNYRGSKFYSNIINDGRIDDLTKTLEKALAREIRIELIEL